MSDEPEPTAAEPQTMTVRIILVFDVDGQPAINVPFEASLQVPGPEQWAQLVLRLDGRELLRVLEPKLGPTLASVSTPAAAREPIPIRRKRTRQPQPAGA